MKKRIRLIIIFLSCVTSLFAENDTNNGVLADLIAKNSEFLADLLTYNSGFIFGLVILTILIYVWVNIVRPKFLIRNLEKIRNVLIIGLIIVAFVSFFGCFVFHKIDFSLFIKLVSIAIPSSPLLMPSVKNKEINIDVKDSRHTVIQVDNKVGGSSINNSSLSKKNNDDA